jgi:PAS domain S-box-containing protein
MAKKPTYEELEERVKELEKENTGLKQSEERFRLLAEGSHDLITIADINMKPLWVNQAWEDRFGPLSEYLESPSELIHPDDAEKAMEAWDRVVHGQGCVTNIEYRYKNPFGGYWTFETTVYRMPPPGGDKFCVIAHDITEHKQAEEALRESEEKWRSLVSNTPDTIINLDRNGTILFINHTVPGYTVEGTIGKTVYDFIPPEKHDITMKSIETVFKTGESVNFETSVIGPDNNLLWYSTRLGPIKEGEKIIGAAQISTNITERKQAEEEKARLEKQLRRAQKLETIGTLASGIAHDFNNILAPILGYTDMALLRLEQTDPLYENLQHVLKSAYRAKDLVEQILLFSTQIEKERKPLNLQVLVKEALKLLRPSIPTTIEIRQRIDAPCAKVRADATQVHQVILNLCTNAWQAMEEKGGTLSIELNQKKVDPVTAKLHPNLKEEEYVCLSIIDTGHGMNEETLDRIFEPFFTTKTVEKGTGLGLSVVHGIVRSHKGDILVYSEPGKGAAFHVYLPAIKSEDVTVEAASKAIIGGTEFVMIVDDEPGIAVMVKKMLEGFGYKTDVYNTGLAALKAFKQQPDKYDLLISDLTMPHMTGLDLADQLHKERPELPVVIMTGFSDSLTVPTQDRHGIKQVIGKPIVARELAATVRKVLDK